MLSFFFENLRLGWRNLRLHKLRSLLTALGIIFGVAAVIIMVAIGQGAKKQAKDQMDQLGATNVLIRSVVPPASTNASSQQSRMIEYGLKRSDFDRLKNLSGVDKAVPLRDVGRAVIAGDQRAEARAIATIPLLFDVIHLTLARGQFFTAAQGEAQAQVCVLGDKVANDLFPQADPIGQRVQVGTTGQGAVILQVVGVLAPTGMRNEATSGGNASGGAAGFIGRDIDRDVYFPLPLARSQFGDLIIEQGQGTTKIEKVELTEVWLQTKEQTQVESLAERAKHVLGRPERKDVQVKAPLEILRNAERLGQIFNFIMVGIASFSLVVGGIGIMNIMLASVTERTREIGIRRALGAKRKHITLQFLIETTTISLSGGLLGISIGVGIALVLPILVRQWTDNSYPTEVTSSSVLISFIVSGLIGIGFGLYPAVKAARMSPIEALRHE